MANNPEPFLIITSSQDISTKKSYLKIKEFINNNINENNENENNGKQSIRIGKVSDELLEKLQTICNELEKQGNKNDGNENKKKKKHKIELEKDEEVNGGEEVKPKKKKSRKSSSE